MFWITKYRHNQIVDEYKEALSTQKEAINRKEKFEDICDRLTQVVEKIHPNSFFVDTCDGGGWVTASDVDVMAGLDDSVPIYVDDYFGGKVIKQESYPVTHLDKQGKAGYGVTARKPKKGDSYILIQD